MKIGLTNLSQKKFGTLDSVPYEAEDNSFGSTKEGQSKPEKKLMKLSVTAASLTSNLRSGVIKSGKAREPEEANNGLREVFGPDESNALSTALKAERVGNASFTNEFLGNFSDDAISAREREDHSSFNICLILFYIHLNMNTR